MWGGGGIGSWEEGGRNGLDLGRRVGDVLDLGRRVVGMDWILGGGW